MQLLKNYKTKRLRIISANTSLFISKASQEGIVVYNILPLDDLTWEFSVSSSDYPRIKELVRKSGDKEITLSATGIGTYMEKIKKRPILIILVILLLGMSLLLPNWIFFIKVEGNQHVPTQRVLETAENAGIRFGTYRRGIRSEKIKNALLSEIKELSWVGVNTSGCVATISVHEGGTVNKDSIQNRVCSIVAARDGVIAGLTVLHGTPLCKVGNAVEKGQVLISGYTDGGLFVRAEAANGEVFAVTNRKISAIVDPKILIRQDKGEQKYTYWFFVGKKLIKLWKDSGISGATCVKMYERKYVTLPGGYQLPFGILIQKEIAYSCTPIDAEEFSWLEAGCKDYILSQMNAGRIINSSITREVQDGIIAVSCNFTCHEMIGQIRYEEKITDYGKSY